MTKSSDIPFSKVIGVMNKTLKQVHNSLYVSCDEPQTSIHVLGAPRSGTTLLTQLLISNFKVGYITNLTAAFWDAPLFGIYLSEKLLGGCYVSQLESNFGSTDQIREPHEFSYFWKNQLNYPDFLQRTYDEQHTMDWGSLKERLYQMSLASKKPVVYKSFQYGFHAAEAVRFMPKTIFILIERDLFQNAYSILNLRLKMNGNDEEWASIKPVQYAFLKNENKYRQIIGQILSLNYEYRKQFKAIPEDNKAIISYHTLCKQTDGVLKGVSEVINKNKNVDYTYIEQDILETIKVIPYDILQEFKNAKKWILENFPELTE